MSSHTMIWPNFFIVGAPKCGTTTLYEYLKDHPQVFFPKVKEPHFFTTFGRDGRVIRDFVPQCTLERYQRLYQGARGYAAVGDASTNYLWEENAAERIKEACPNARIIIILRDPIVRAHSDHLMYLKFGFEKEQSFLKAMQQYSEKGWNNGTIARNVHNYIGRGLYYTQVRRYLEVFGSDQVLILFSDELAKSPRTLFQKVSSHLGIDPAPFDGVEASRVHNNYRMPRFKAAYRIAGVLGLRTKLLPRSVVQWLSYSPLLFATNKTPLDDESRRFLQPIFDPDIAQLEGLLGRKLPELRKSWI